MHDLGDFALYLRASRKAAGTIKQRDGDLERFKASTGIEPCQATTRDLRTYLASGTEIWAAEYQKRIRTSFRDFYAWLVAEGIRDDNPATGLAPISIPRDAFAGKAAPERIVQAAFSGCTVLRDRLIITLGATMGLRRSEIASLRLTDRTDDLLRVTGKGGHTRVIPLDTLTLNLLREREREIGYAPYYFPGRWTGHAHPATIARWARRHLAGYPLDSLRHRAATVGNEETKDLRAVQTFMGHASVATTQLYIENRQSATRKVSAATSLVAQDAEAGEALAPLLVQAAEVGVALRPFGLALRLDPVSSPLPQE